MKEEGVWQLDLSKMLENESVSTLSDFQSLPKDTVLKLIDDAKKTGFMHAAKLKALHPSFPKKKKKKKQAVASKKKASIKQKDAETLKREARPILEKYMRENGIWQIDLFNLMTDEYEIYSVDEFEQLKSDTDMADEFLEQAKHCGVSSLLSELCIF